MKNDAKSSYSGLKAQLEAVMTKLEDESIDVDEAIKLFEQSQKIIDELDKYLKVSEAKITKINKSA